MSPLSATRRAHLESSRATASGSSSWHAANAPQSQQAPSNIWTVTTITTNHSKSSSETTPTTLTFPPVSPRPATSTAEHRRRHERFLKDHSPSPSLGMGSSSADTTAESGPTSKNLMPPQPTRPSRCRVRKGNGDADVTLAQRRRTGRSCGGGGGRDF